MGKKDAKTETARPEPPETTCHFYLERKQRYCRHKQTTDTKFCAEHATIAGVKLGRKRVFCPYDSKHTCYETKVQNHMKKCPSRPQQMPAYFSTGINTGDDAGETVPDPKATVLTVSVEELEVLIETVHRLHEEHIETLVEEILSHPCMKEEVANTSYGTAAMRHRKQQASLIGQMEELGLLTDDRCFLEMGAGRGALSHWLRLALEEKQNIGFVLIDRSHVRNKMDNLHKREMIMERIRIDIEHLKLEKVPSIEKNARSVVAFGKHLCGPATDLTLRCITETLPSKQETSQHSNDEDGGVPRKRLKSETRHLSGAVIALCCHHRCAWKPYVGKAFFQSCGLTARDFQIISSMSSWATCAWKGWSFQRKQEAKHTNNQTDVNAIQDGSVSDIVKDLNSETTQAGENKANINAIQDGSASDKVKDFNSKTVQDEVTNIPGENIANINESTNTSAASDKQSVDSLKHDSVIVTNRTDNGGKTVKEAIEDTGNIVNDSSCGDGKIVSEGKNAGVVDDVRDHEEEEHCQEGQVTNAGINKRLSEAEREAIGRKCKRLIDYGRVRYLQEHGMSSSLKIFIEEYFTPENVVLVAAS